MGSLFYGLTGRLILISIKRVRISLNSHIMDNLKTCSMQQDYSPLHLKEGDLVRVKTDLNGDVVVGPKVDEFSPGCIFIKISEDNFKLVPEDYINTTD